MSINLRTQDPGLMGVLTADTTDLPVAEEAAVTAELSRFQVLQLWDVGVAGIHRLIRHRAVVDQADVLRCGDGDGRGITQGGGGLFRRSNYGGTHQRGLWSHNWRRISTADHVQFLYHGIGVVNIDNELETAMLAGQILRTAHRILEWGDRPPIS
ncbi:MAG: hypothetical protein AAFO87_00955 [Cyanobacteria bacterium J06607_6]